MNFTKISEDAESVLLLCDGCITAKPMHERPEPVDFHDSTLYAWLNGEFAEKHLTEEERSRLIEVTLLSSEEAEAYLPDKGCKPDASISDAAACSLSYADAAGVSVTDLSASRIRTGANGNCWWWLRDKGFAEDFFRIVDFAGHICSQGTYVTLDTNGVRPLIRLHG